jgi:hypothetical protein
MCGDEKDQKANAVEPTLEPLLQAHIGKQLREMFSAMANEPVPDKFRQLLDRLEAGERTATAPRPEADDEATAL